MPLLLLLLLDAASGEVQPPVPEPTPMGGAGGFAPVSRREWEEARALRLQELEPEQAEAPEAAPLARPARPLKDPLSGLFTTPPAPVPVPVPVVVAPDFTVTDEEMAVIALVLTARVNAYRWANTGLTQPLRAA